MATARDPVCGMEVDTDTAIRVQHGDHTHYFCSETCREKFLADPAAYGDAHAAGGAGTTEENPPFTVDEHGIAAPKFGSAGSGGAEFEPLPPGARD
jgi:P-type Cu+ transporter